MFQIKHANCFTDQVFETLKTMSILILVFLPSSIFLRCGSLGLSLLVHRWWTAYESSLLPSLTPFDLNLPRLLRDVLLSSYCLYQISISGIFSPVCGSFQNLAHRSRKLLGFLIVLILFICATFCAPLRPFPENNIYFMRVLLRQNSCIFSPLSLWFLKQQSVISVLSE